MSAHALLSAPLMRTDGPLFVRGHQVGVAATRSRLSRWWLDRKPRLILPWIMLNPSTADGETNDPTLRRVVDFTYRWGFDGLRVFNLFHWRTPSPRELARIVVGWDERQAWDVRDDCWANHGYIARQLAEVDAAMVAWGSPGGRLGEETSIWASDLIERIAENQPADNPLHLWCLGKTVDGSPKHPLARGVHRVPSDARPILYRENAL